MCNLENRWVDFYKISNIGVSRPLVVNHVVFSKSDCKDLNNSHFKIFEFLGF